MDRYVDALEFVIRNKDAEILDTACGSGFPMLALRSRGFGNVSASDADAYSVEELKKLLAEEGVATEVFEGTWQELGARIGKKFDVLVNADNSFVYMDGWDMDSEHCRLNFMPGREYAFARAKLVLGNFREVLKDGGMAIVGLGKHYDPPSREYDSIHNATPMDPIVVNGQELSTRWYGTHDWEERVHEWYTDLKGGDIDITVLRKSYLYTKDEIADMMREVGFSAVHIVEPEGTRDNLIVGIR